MLKLSSKTVLFSKRDIAAYVTGSLKVVVLAQLQVLASEEGDEYGHIWLRTLQSGLQAAEVEYAAANGLLARVPMYTREDLDARLTFFIDIQRVRAQVACRRNPTLQDEIARDVWQNWQSSEQPAFVV